MVLTWSASSSEQTLPLHQWERPFTQYSRHGHATPERWRQLACISVNSESCGSRCAVADPGMMRVYREQLPGISHEHLQEVSAQQISPLACSLAVTYE